MLPGAGVVGVLELGTVVLGVPPGYVDPGVACGVPTGGVAVRAGGVAVLAGGVTGPTGGVAGEPGVEVCPAVPGAPAGGAPLGGAACATPQLAQPSTTDNNTYFDFDI